MSRMVSDKLKRRLLTDLAGEDSNASVRVAARIGCSKSLLHLVAYQDYCPGTPRMRFKFCDHYNLSEDEAFPARQEKRKQRRA